MDELAYVHIFSIFFFLFTEPICANHCLKDKLKKKKNLSVEM